MARLDRASLPHHIVSIVFSGSRAVASRRPFQEGMRVAILAGKYGIVCLAPEQDKFKFTDN